MARKKKGDSEAAETQSPEDRDHDPNGHYDFCTIVISPPGHKPLASCHLRVWWHSRRPLAWRTKKATPEDHFVEHVCREWTMSEDGRHRALIEETSADRHGIKGDTAVVLSKMKKNSPLTSFPTEVATLAIKADVDAGFAPLVPVRPKRKLAEKAASNITLNGEKADANVRTARKVHACSSCDRSVGHGMKYLESRVGAKSAFEPFRYCDKCWPVLGYVVVE